jgi:phosphoglycerate dehydrogenase-like enzyme
VIVWLPFGDVEERLGPLPGGIETVEYAGGEDVPASLDSVEVVVPHYSRPGRTFELLARMPRLRVLQLLTAGTEHAEPHLPPGVVLCNARGVHDASTAELAVGLALAVLRGIPDFVRAQDTGRWAPGRRDALADRRVLVLGAGSVGHAVGRRLKPFEVDVVLVARTARDGVRGTDELADLLPRCDVVVLTVPLTDATRGLVDADFLARLPDGALVVNVARGPVVDTAALLPELESGRLRAALDVTDPEPLPPEHPLWRAPGLLVSPHVGGDTTAFPPRAYALIADQLRRIAVGEPLRNVVVPAGQDGPGG